MTRETKIGLLVGLAFIIFFGIILSERGAGTDQQRMTPPTTAYKPVVELVAPTGDVQPRLVRATPPTRVVQSEDKDRPTAVQQHSPTDESTVDPSKSTAPPAKMPTDISPRLRKLIQDKPTKELARIPPSQPSGTSSSETGQVRLVEAAKAPVQPVLTVYEIKSGETLWGICQQRYSGRAYAMLNQVISLNKIDKPERLRAGQKIKLPVATEAGEARDVLVDSAAADKQPILVKVPTSPIGRTADLGRTTADRRVVPVLFRSTPPDRDAVKITWYVVQDKDTLSRIAKEVYGHEGSWHRLYENNRDIIKNPNMLRSGLKIRIPQGSTELAAGSPVSVE